MAELVDYAKTKGVDVWVWKAHQMILDDERRNYYFANVKQTGAVGVKIDFMDSESHKKLEFHEKALIDGARHKLMINFHGANKPAGESRTYPNEMTREGIRGLEYNKFSLTPLTPEHNCGLPFTRLLAGHADYTPVTFNPKKLGKTSYAHQLALPIALFSSVTHYADKPEMYLENPPAAPAIEIMKKLPATWDETIVLPQSQIRELAAFARRKGDVWYVGVLNGSGRRDITIETDFLDGPGHAVVLSDEMDNPAAFRRQEIELDSDGKIEAAMRPGGGLVAMITSG